MRRASPFTLETCLMMQLLNTLRKSLKSMALLSMVVYKFDAARVFVSALLNMNHSVQSIKKLRYSSYISNSLFFILLVVYLICTGWVKLCVCYLHASLCWMHFLYLLFTCLNALIGCIYQQSCI